MTYAIALLLALGAAPALAANAEQPNTNVDKSNDKGGPHRQRQDGSAEPRAAEHARHHDHDHDRHAAGAHAEVAVTTAPAGPAGRTAR